MEFLSSPEAGLWGLFLSSFLAATLLPGGSEAVLFAVLKAHPDRATAALLLATVGNTLGGMTTYWMGRLLPQRLPPERSTLARRWGAPVLLLAWAPVVGDALCAAAGWLRLPLFASVFWMALGKGARYVLVLVAVGAF
ncbi:MAG: DedA family protein [Candidatus Nitricoxidivorans perseverans]|uniref:DedA family protein n=1 Tax=Candidatus Nitricoxidivorans perseverans TaxID=2975601 RepID=A0AA49FJH4_9PROT|nr:MAG: DedA family protein [Candidatus Nitricoxidivorans perseverans]